MAIEPDKQMDELLKASAQARRGEFGREPSMPNPMRARLYEEIASTTATKPSSRFHLGWPRFLIWTTATAAALFIALATFWQWRESTAPTVVSSGAEANKPVSAASERAANDEAKTRQAPAMADERQSLAKAAAAAPAPAVAAAKTSSIAQQFAQMPAKQKVEKSVTQGVLDHFKLEQDGEAVRVIDADGSTYTGKMERLARSDARALSSQKLEYAKRAASAHEDARLPAGETTRPGAARKETELTTNEYRIRASGYNVQLKKPLMFEGNYIAPSSSNEAQEKDARSQARVIGTAKIEGVPPFQVDAVAVPP
jgi:hypothetical protein